MIISAKFQELKDNINKDYIDYKSGTSFTFPHIQLGTWKVEELVEEGFVKRKIELLLGSSDTLDIEQYYKEECSDIKCSTLETFEIPFKDKTTNEFIFEIKLNVVRMKLNQELSNYLKEIKSDA